MRRKSFLIAALLLLFNLFLTGRYLAAQIGGGFDLSWATIDNGGGTFSNGGAFTLGGTVGQPDASLGELSGGSYRLQGGFWQERCVPLAAVLPAPAINGTQVQLSWPLISGAASYNIYRAADAPYFLPAIPYANSAVVPWDDPDLNSVGDPATNYYYLIRTVNCTESSDSQRIGEFDFAIQPGS